LTADAEARFAAAWREAGAPKRLLLAVSGGGDSIAMMRLAAPLARGGVRIRVATVDHGLRPASAADADFVMHEAAALGLEAAILRWNGAKPDAGVQAAARAARYRLLASEAERSKAEAILTAHTAEDQAETLLMRIAHSTGVRGLSGMAGEVFIADGAGPPQRLLRLLLGERRKALRDYLAALGARGKA
jgi:tRNA(Ile)-lysidine synthase